MSERTCTIEGCDRPHSGRGWCVHHYGKWRKTGDPNYQAPSLEERFWAKVNKDAPAPEHRPELGPCWTWLGFVDQDGYGKSWNGQQITFAHRYSHAMFVGPIPDGFQVDHLCRVRHCVNPAHLQAVPPAVNNDRSESVSAHNGRKEFCNQGHEFDLTNTYWRPDGSGRDCRKCRAAADQRRAERRRAKRAQQQASA